MKIFLNDKFVDQSKAMLSVFDHGVLYGDGVFEGIRAYGGKIFKLEEHVERLYESAHTIMLKVPMEQKELCEVLKKSLKVNDLTDAYIRLVVTRGVGDLGLDPRKCPKASLFIISDKIQLYPKAIYEKGLEIVTVATQRNVPEALNPQIKSLNYLNNILAKIEAVNAGYQEALMLSHSGYVTECTGENVFLVKGNQLLTPPPYIGVLKGITRDVAMDLGQRMGLDVKEDLLTRHDLYNADEVFLTGTAAEIIPVSKIDGRKIGLGKRGKITQRLQEDYHALTLQ